MKFLTLCAAISLTLTGLVFAGPFIVVGQHPVSPMTAYPNIHSLTPFEGRIYMGYGNYNYYPVQVISCYDPATNTMRMEHSAGTDAVDLMRVLDGKLFVPSVDPIHYEDFADISWLTPGTGWRDRSPVGAFHNYDAAQLGTDLFVCGSRDIAENEGSGAGSLHISRDNGATWNLISSNSTYRYYWCMVQGGNVWVADGYWNGSSFIQNSRFSGSSFYKTTTLPTDIAISLSGRDPTSSVYATNLLTFDGTTLRAALTGIVDFCWTGSELYLLTATSILRATSITAELIETEPVEGLTDLPQYPRALAVTGGTFYVSYGSSLYAARADDAPVPTSPETVNALPDSLGRSLAFHGNRLCIGAPDAGPVTVPLSGQLSAWTLPANMGDSWLPAETLTPPVPSLSGWFGKDAAASGDLMAVVESGHDGSGSDRGSAAKVHIYQFSEGSYTWRSTRQIPFVHSVYFDGNMLLAGTGNPAANQAAGLPGVIPHTISRDAANIPSFTGAAQLQPQNGRAGYKPVARIATAGGRLIAGFSGDPSRDGGDGTVSVWLKNVAGTGYPARPFQEITSAAGSSAADRFGYAIAAAGDFLAVGAPRADQSARQAGRVYFYRWAGISYQLVTVLTPPDLNAEAGFGSAIAIDGFNMLIGAPGVTVNGEFMAGAVYYYKFVNTSWQFVRRLKRPAASRSGFGIEVALNDTWLAAGSRFSNPSPKLTDRVALETPANIADWYASHAIGEAERINDADPDGDGLSNLMEYACGLDPLKPDSTSLTDTSPGLPVVAVERTGPDSHLLLSWVQPATDGLMEATVEAGPSLTTFTPVNPEIVSTTTANGYIHRTARLPAPSDGTRLFARVRYTYR